MKMLNTLLASALLATPGLICATHYEPWVPPANEINAGADYTFQWYRHLKYGSDSVSYHSDNSYLHLFVSDSLIDRLNVELEYSVFRASAIDNNLNSDYFKMTGHYQLLDNLCGDAVSLATHLAVTVPTAAARHNPGEFHHSDVDFELHASLGKQFPADACEQCLNEEGHLVPLVRNVRGMENYWVDLGVGHGTSGAAYMELQAAGEKQFKDVHFIRLRGDYNHGFGHEKLHGSTFTGFPGYARLNYDAVDLEARYTFEFGCNKSLSASYMYRVFARNCPGSANNITVAYNMAF